MKTFFRTKNKYIFFNLQKKYSHNFYVRNVIVQNEEGQSSWNNNLFEKKVYNA